MANLSDNLGYVPVVRIETSDVALGGNETNQPNKALKELASRDAAILELLGGTDTTAQATVQTFQQLGIAGTAQGRLTLESGVPVSSTDQLAKTTLHYTPYIGSFIAIYNTSESRWELREFTQRSLSLSGSAVNGIYDMFAYWDGDSVELESVVWTNTTTRATAITQLDGIWVKSTDNRRYLGTILTEVSGQCEDSALKRCVFNYQNRVPRSLTLAFDPVDYTYTTETWRSSNGGTRANARVIAMAGLGDVTVTMIAALVTVSENATTLPCPGGAVGIGLNQVTTPDSIANSGRPATADSLTLISIGNFALRIGFNDIIIMEFGFNGNGTTTGDFTVVSGGLGGTIIL